MVHELLVRLYNVGLGDCIYLRVPDGKTARHILIDCGNRYASGELLAEAIEDLKEQLAANDATLDLLVATHAHTDHIQGFDSKRFADIQIERIWLSAAMDPDHEQAEEAQKLHDFTKTKLTELAASDRPALAELAASLLSLRKDEAVKALQEELPAANGIRPLYVHAQTEEEKLRIFTEEGTRFRVLAPMRDIDRFYLGCTRDGEDRGEQSAPRFKGLDNFLGFNEVYDRLAHRTALTEAYECPRNISEADFERLKERLRSNAFAFALEEGHLVNNTSVVLLLEWRGRRLLFTGDAEVKTEYGGEFREGTSNGSWNVMWKEQREQLARPLDFLKVGHHGSENATPWTARPHPINAILDALLPEPGEGEAPAAWAVVSTERSGYPTIPSPALMEELGKRVGNRERYQESEERGYFVAADILQPQRTDLKGGKYIDVTFTPA